MALALAALQAQAQQEPKQITTDPAGKESLAVAAPKGRKTVRPAYLTKVATRKIAADPEEAVTMKTATTVSSPVAEIRAFPNPFSSQIDVIITDGAMAKSVYKANLYDSSGKRVHSETLPANQSSLQLSQLDAGVYFLQVEKNGVLLKQQKFVKL
jgi:hypothetical protein